MLINPHVHDCVVKSHSYYDVVAKANILHRYILVHASLSYQI